MSVSLVKKHSNFCRNIEVFANPLLMFPLFMSFSSLTTDTVFYVFFN